MVTNNKFLLYLTKRRTNFGLLKRTSLTNLDEL